MQTSTPVSPPLHERHAGTRAARASLERALWVDAAKGLGIVLVVAGHAIDGLLAARLADAQGGWSDAYFAIYTFHMPLFFLLAGLFVPQRLAGDPDGFVHDALVRIAWPYLLWSVVQLAVIGALGSLVNNPTRLDAWRIVSLAWEPTSQFWFLQALLVLHLLGRVLLPRIGPVAWLGLMVVARGVDATVDLPHLLGLPARFGIWYALGVLAGPRLLALIPVLTRRQLATIAGIAALAWAAAALPVRAAELSHWSVAAAPAALAGCIALVALAALARPGSAWGERWAALGRASMAIFLLHVLCVAGVRIVLHKVFGIDAALPIFVLACVLGISVPVVLRLLARRAGLSRALGLA
jgi:fucose 4-O-acetylase-like acetyltransferase